MMDHGHNIILREGDGENPEGLLRKLATEIQEFLSSCKQPAADYVRGKGKAELAKAMEIMSRAISEIGKLDNERKRLVQEHRAAEAAAENEHEKNRLEHERGMYALRTERLKAMQAIPQLIRELKELGVNVTASVETVRMVLSGGSDRQGSR